MTDSSTKPLLETASNADRSPFDPRSMDGRDVHFDLAESTGNWIKGRIELAKPNPYHQTVCEINYVAPKSWPADRHAAAIRLAGHWFRDIGGPEILRKADVCHIVQRLYDQKKDRGVREPILHEMIDQYAFHDWHREHRAWKPIRRFFDTRHDRWIHWLDMAVHELSKREAAERNAAKRARAGQEYAAQRAKEMEDLRKELDERKKQRQAQKQKDDTDRQNEIESYLKTPEGRNLRARQQAIEEKIKQK